MNSKTYRTKSGKYSLKGANYRSKVVRVTLEEYNMLSKYRLINKETKLAVFEQDTKEKCRFCLLQGKNDIFSVHASCLDSILSSF